jgi:hypothetical protein
MGRILLESVEEAAVVTLLVIVLVPTVLLLLLAFLPLVFLWPAFFAAWRLLEARRRIAEEPPEPGAHVPGISGP